jgi:transposase-like protein
MSKTPKRISDAEKVKAIKLHLLEKKPVSEVCDEMEIAPSAYYKWQLKLFENAESALKESKKPSKESNDQKHIKLLEQRLQLREEALSELMIDHVKLKKSVIGLV